jgi:hypothetical protein
LRTHFEKDYFHVANQMLGGLHLAIYSKKALTIRISGIFWVVGQHVDIKSSRVATGEAGMSNKGGIAISFKIDKKAFLIVNSHLPGLFV